MDLKFRYAYTQVMNPAVIAGLLLFILPSVAIGMEEPKPAEWKDIQMVGVIGPDGRNNLWAISISGGGELLGLLARQPSKINNGIRYFELSSWEDMAEVLTALSRQQARVIQQLAQDMQKLNNRLSRLEKKSRRIVYSGSRDYRLKKLEEKVEYMSDGGNP